MLNSGDFFRFEVTKVSLLESVKTFELKSLEQTQNEDAREFIEQLVELQDLEFKSRSRNRQVADSSCKVLFQYYARQNEGVTFEVLTEVFRQVS